MKNLGQLIFDMDGTIIDDIELQAELFASIAASSFGVGLMHAKAYYIESAGQPLAQQFTAIAQPEKSNPLPPGLISSLVSEFDAELRQVEPRLYPETRQSLHVLKEGGYQLFVSSGATQETVDRKLRKTEIYDLFTLRLGSNPDENFIKGHAHFSRIRQEMQLEEDEFRKSSIFIGDSLHDIRVGKEERILTAGRIGTFSQDELLEAQADFVFIDLEQLVHWLSRADDADGFNLVFDLHEK